MKEAFARLFLQEQIFLDEICDSIASEKNLKDVQVNVVALEDQESELTSVMFQKTIGQKERSKDDPSGRILLYLEPLHKDKSILIDVCGGEAYDRQKFSSMAVGISHALRLFRGGKYEMSAYECYGNRKTMRRLPIVDYAIMHTVEKWLKEDEHYQFFREITSPYVKGYFEKIDLLGMGAEMIAAIKEEICTCAKEQGDRGTFAIEICPHDKQMRRAFGDIEEDSDNISSEMKITKYFKMNNPREITLGTGELNEIYLHFADDDPLNVKVKIWTPREIKVKEYERRILVTVIKYVETWSEITLAQGYELEISEQTTKF